MKLIADSEFQRKKKYLARYVKIRHHIDSLEEQLFELDVDTGVHSPALSPASGSSNVKDYKAQYERVDEMNERINLKLERARKVRQEIYAVLDTLDNPKEAQILELHFIDDQTFYMIALQTHYSLRWVERLYRTGITNCQVPEAI